MRRWPRQSERERPALDRQNAGSIIGTRLPSESEEILFLAPRELHKKAVPPISGLRPDPPSVEFDDLLRDGKPEAIAPSASPALIDPVKTAEDLFAVLRTELLPRTVYA